MRPTLIRSALNGNVQKWLIDGSGFKDPNVFLSYAERSVKETVDNVDGAKKVYINLKCILFKVDLKTDERIYANFNGRS